ncbi:MAG: hypothetical protein EOO23_03515 [Comamonadaceae bacterium]|nr:MAG: hypothetical protein EOO23_03515 [Comamonadaceae bacterium]
MTNKIVAFNPIVRALFAVCALVLIALGQIWMTVNPLEIAMDVLAPGSLVILAFAKNSSDKAARLSLAVTVLLMIVMIFASASARYAA